MKLSQVFSDFNTEVNESVSYIDANKVRLKVDPAQATEELTFLTDWNLKYPLYTGALTHNASTVKDIQDLYHLFHPSLSGLKKQMKNNKAVTLTGTDFGKMHIHQDAATRAHIPRPAFAPTNTLLKNTHLVNQIFTSNPNPPHEKETNLPVDVDKIGRSICYTKVGDPAPAPELYHHIESIGATVYDIVSNALNVGMVANMITFYINSTGEEGPASAPISFIVV